MAEKLVLVLGFLLRMLLFYLSPSWLMDRVEISTPLNSWASVEAAGTFHRQGVSPYRWSIFHGSPLVFLFANWLANIQSRTLVHVVFAVIDIITGRILALTARAITEHLCHSQNRKSKRYLPNVQDTGLLLTAKELKNVPFYVETAYLFNPYLLLNCLGQTLTVFENFLLAISIFCGAKGKQSIMCMCLAVCSCQCVYTVMLLVPTTLHCSQQSTRPWFTAVKMIATYAASVTVVILLGKALTGGWDFITATYEFTLTAPNLKPNIGLYWYFFTEMFSHFHTFFMFVFQLNVFAYTAPLAIRFWDEPWLVTTVIISIMAVFKPYPCVGDVGLALSLIPLWSHLYKYMRQVFVVGCMILVSTVLAPILYNLWKYQGSANANFYFAVTLSFATAQIFLVSDLLFAYIRRDYYLHHANSDDILEKRVALVLK